MRALSTSYLVNCEGWCEREFEKQQNEAGGSARRGKFQFQASRGNLS